MKRRLPMLSAYHTNLIRYYKLRLYHKYILLAGILISCFGCTIHEKNYRYACGVPMDSINRIGPQELVHNPKYKWKRAALRVFFTDIDDDKLKKKTLDIANIWSKHISIKFVLATDKGTSDIRVSFREPDGYKSIIGNLATKDKYIGKATLWLENLDQRSDDEFKRVVLHEFGHSLALLHELQSPNANVDWDTAEVYKYFIDKNHWDSTRVKDEILNKKTDVKATRFDPLSIMIYAIPASITKSKKAIPWPNKLSQLDTLTIHTIYPNQKS